MSNKQNITKLSDIIIILNTLNNDNNENMRIKKDLKKKIDKQRKDKIQINILLINKLKIIKKNIFIGNNEIEIYYEKLIKIINKLIIEKNKLDIHSIKKYKKYLRDIKNKKIRFYNHRLRHIDMISGPVSFNFYKNIIGKRILILGDYHTIKNFCINKYIPDVGEYISILANSLPNNNCLDIFAEEMYYKKEKVMSGGFIDENSGSMLNNVIEEFGYKKYIKNIRYHYVDIRTYYYNNYNNVLHGLDNCLVDNDLKKNVIFNITTDEKIIYENTLLYNDVINNYDDIIKMLVGFDYNEKILNIYIQLVEQTLSNLKTKMKVPKNIEICFKKENIKKYISIVHNLINKEISKMTINKEKFKKTILNIIIKKIKDHVSKFPQIVQISYLFELDIGTYKQDIYTLARIFMKFDDKKINREGISCINSHENTMKNIVIYCGEYHAQTLNLFIKSIFNIDPYISENQKMDKNMSQCIKLQHPLNYNKNIK